MWKSLKELGVFDGCVVVVVVVGGGGVLCSELITRDEDMNLKEVGWYWRDWRGWGLRTGRILLVVQMWR